jgi:putative ABC transport system ATP-binding protein
VVAHIRGERGAAVRARAERLLGEVGLTERAGQLPAELSGGERQRVGIARALMAEPTVLLADEPTAALDGELSAQIAALLAEQARSRALATLVVSHDDAPLAHADRHLHLSTGALAPRAAVAG